MTKNRSTAFQVLTTFGTRVIVLLGSFIASIVLARVLGPEGKGIITAVFVVPNLIISFADLGVRQATAYYVGKKIYPIQDIFSSVLVMWLITSFLSTFVVALYFSSGPNETYGWGMLLIALTTIPIGILNTYILGMLLGKEKIGSINIKEIISFLVNLMSITLLVWLLQLGVYGAAVTQILIALSILIYGIMVLKKDLLFRFKVINPIPTSLFKKGISYALALFILNLNYKIDIIFLEKLTTPSKVGIYSVGVSLAELVWQLPAVIGMILFSKSANSKFESSAIDRSTKLLRITWIPMILICFILWIFSPLFISILYGSAYIEASSVIRSLIPGILTMVIFKILNADLAGRGKPLFAFKVYLLTLIINISLNALLIPGYGINGAAFASSVSYTVGGIIFGLVYSKNSNIKFSSLFILTKKDFNLVKSSLQKIIKFK